MQDGRLEAIFRRWHIWNDDQPGSTRGSRVRAEAAPADDSVSLAGGAAEPAPVGSDAAPLYLPALLSAAAITLVLSCLSMALAVGLGS